MVCHFPVTCVLNLIGRRCIMAYTYSKTCFRRQHKNTKISFQDRLSLNPKEHSKLLLTFNWQPFVFKIFVLSIFESPFQTGFTRPWTGFAARFSATYCQTKDLSTPAKTLICIHIRCSGSIRNALPF